MNALKELEEEFREHSDVPLLRSLQPELLELIQRLLADLGLDASISDGATNEDLEAIIKILLKKKYRLMTHASKLIAHPRKSKKPMDMMSGIMLGIIFSVLISQPSWLSLGIQAAYSHIDFKPRRGLGF